MACRLSSLSWSALRRRQACRLAPTCTSRRGSARGAADPRRRKVRSAGGSDAPWSPEMRDKPGSSLGVGPISVTEAGIHPLLLDAEARHVADQCEPEGGDEAHPNPPPPT